MNNNLEALARTYGVDQPRVTDHDVENAIVKDQYWAPDGTMMVVCALTLRNGFVVVGTGLCVDPEGYDADESKRRAYNDARRQVWAYEQYLLRQKLVKGAH
jgi:hypothetical protein